MTRFVRLAASFLMFTAMASAATVRFNPQQTIVPIGTTVEVEVILESIDSFGSFDLLNIIIGSNDMAVTSFVYSPEFIAATDNQYAPSPNGTYFSDLLIGGDTQSGSIAVPIVIGTVTIDPDIIPIGRYYFRVDPVVDATDSVVALDFSSETVSGAGSVLICNSGSDCNANGIPDDCDIGPDDTGKRIYWTKVDNPSRGIHRAYLDGSLAELLVGPGGTFPTGIDVDPIGSAVYWTDFTLDRIERADLDGSGHVNLIAAGIDGPTDLAIDLAHGKLYWLELDSTPKKLRRANLDATGVETLITSGLVFPVAIALDVAGGKVYWSDEGNFTIKRANLDGSNVQTLVSSGLSQPEGLALDLVGRKMYWTDRGLDIIKRANLNGTNVETLISSGLSLPQGIVVDADRGFIFWSGLATGAIRRANLDGTGIVDVLTTDDPWGIALDLSSDDCSGNGVVDECEIGDVPLVVTYEATPNEAIPDCPGGSNPFVESTIIVPNDTGIAEHVAVEVEIEHSYLGDLLIVLESPAAAREITLMSRIGLAETDPFCTAGQCCGCSLDNMHVIFDDAASRDIETVCPPLPGGRYRPNPGASPFIDELSDLVGDAVAGAWHLHVYDGAGTDTGTLVRWALHITRTFIPSAGDCNHNGRPDLCDIFDGLSTDFDSDGAPDECGNFTGLCSEPGEEDFWTCFDNWDLGGTEYPDDDDSAANVDVLLDDSDDVFLNDTVKIPSLTMIDNSVLRVTKMGATGDLQFSLPAVATIQGTIYIDWDRKLGEPDALDGQHPPNPIKIGPGGTYAKYPSAASMDVSATLYARDLIIQPGSCAAMKNGGQVLLSDSMELIVSRNLILESGATPFCGFFLGRGMFIPLGITPPPKLVRVGDSMVQIANNMLIGESAETVNAASSSGVGIAGDFLNESHYPSLFNWEQGRLEMNGTDLQYFEVGGLDFGASDEGFNTNADTLFDTDTHTNFSIGILQIGKPGQPTTVEFVNDFANTSGVGLCREALYVHTLIIEPGSEIRLNDCRVYAGNIMNNSGTITPVSGTCGGALEICNPDPPGPGGVRKVRYLSFDGGNPGSSTAMRVTTPVMDPPFNGLSGAQAWVGAPRLVSLIGGVSDATPPTFWAATLQCEPHYTDWSLFGTVHVYHATVLPFGNYTIEAIQAGCSVAESSSYSDPLIVSMSIWGDVVGSFGGGMWFGPDNSVDVTTDMLAVIDGFRSAPTAPIKPRSDVEPGTPDQLINITDAVVVVDAFRGLDYPFPPPPPPCTP